MGKRLSIFPLPRRSPCTHTRTAHTCGSFSAAASHRAHLCSSAKQSDRSRTAPNIALPAAGTRRSVRGAVLVPGMLKRWCCGPTAAPGGGRRGTGKAQCPLAAAEVRGHGSARQRGRRSWGGRPRGGCGFPGAASPQRSRREVTVPRVTPTRVQRGRSPRRRLGTARHGTACSAGVRPERHGVKLGPGSGWWWRGSARFPPLPPSSAARPARSAQHQPAQHQPARLRTPPSPRTLRRSPAQLRRRAFRNNAPSLCRPKAENNGHAEHLPSTESGASPGPPPPSPPPLLASPPRTLRTSVSPAVGTPRRCPPCPLRSPPGGSYLRGAALPAVLRVRSACSGPPAATGRSAGGGGRRGEWGG